MPLNLPCAYVITYDITQPIEQYGPLFNELKSSYKWFHYIENTWIVLRYDSLVELAPILRSLIYQPDRLLIFPAKGPADGWLPNEAWEWINQNIPREW